MHLILNSKLGKCKPLVESFSNSENKQISKSIQIARIGGLLHDIGHGPFSHTFETFLELCGKTWPHENNSMEIILKKIANIFKDKKINPFKIDVREIVSLLCDLDRSDSGIISINKATMAFLKSLNLINSDFKFMEKFLNKFWYLNHIIKEDPYNADRFNYLILDSNRSGAVEYGAIDFERLIQNLQIHKNTVVVSTKAKDAAIRFFEAYTHMYRSIYLHKTAHGGDFHLAYAMYLASKYEKNSIFAKLAKKHDIDTVIDIYDDVLLYFLKQVKHKKCKKIIDDFFTRQLLSPITLSNSKKFGYVIAQIGLNSLGEKIKKQSKVSLDTVVKVLMVTEKRASLPPLSVEELEKVSFLNIETKKLESLDKSLIDVLSSKEYYRVYTTKDKKIKQKVEEAISVLLK